MLSMAKIRKCVYPSPVYEAHFADNTYGRLSVWQPLGKPWDFERARRVLAAIYRKPVVDGYLEHDVADKPWLRVQDPAFSGEAVTETRKRGPSAKQVKAILYDVLAYVDGGTDETVLERARELLAA